ncbi:MAG: hypothetical protein ACYCYR_09660 [Desulfobulbaceae bacterium]
MQPVDIQLPDHTAGDTWEGLTIGPVLFNDAQPAQALSSCRLYFRRQSGGGLGHKLSSTPAAGDGLITITDQATWLITVPAQALPLAVGQWSWDFETTDAAGVIRTLYKGTLTITRDQSYD